MPVLHPPSSIPSTSSGQAFHPRIHRRAAIPWPALFFLCIFAVGIAALTGYYLIPAARAVIAAKQTQDTAGQRAVSATSALLLAIVLLILVAGLLLSFRIGRFFFPRHMPPRTHTKYVDAWAESAKRMPTPPPDSAE